HSKMFTAIALSLLPIALAANIGDFECIDDTKFKQFTSATSFIVQSCPPGFCATRNPPFKNPCIGKQRAAEIDGKAEQAAQAATNAGTALPAAVSITSISSSTSDSPASDSASDPTSSASSAAASASDSATAVDPPPTGFQANDFQCIDDTKFRHFSSPTAFTIGSCPPGFCATRNPPKKNPCIGKARATEIDGKGQA
ncbi:hypothetical protein HDU91_005100, partial [Kappamyces sp. JEL0680]